MGNPFYIIPLAIGGRFGYQFGIDYGGFWLGILFAVMGAYILMTIVRLIAVKFF